MKQLDLFSDWGAEQSALVDQGLNGFYYERSTDRFVSFAIGTRFYEVAAAECDFPKEWQKRVMKERAI